jgi:hypothetical protein
MDEEPLPDVEQVTPAHCILFVRFPLCGICYTIVFKSVFCDLRCILDIGPLWLSQKDARRRSLTCLVTNGSNQLILVLDVPFDVTAR